MFFVSAVVIGCAFYFGIFVYPHHVVSEETRKRSKSFISNVFFREFWYFIMGPLGRRLIAWKVTPNQITWLGFVFAVASAYFFAIGSWGPGGWLVILASTCDIYDGWLARAHGISLKSGSFLDSVLDRISESASFCGLLWYFKADPLWYAMLFLAFSSSQIVSYARARAEGLGFHGSKGFFQRSERMIVLSIGMCLTPIFEFVWPGTGVNVVHVTLIILALGSMQTALTRSYGIYREIRETEIARP